MVSRLTLAQEFPRATLGVTQPLRTLLSIFGAVLAQISPGITSLLEHIADESERITERGKDGIAESLCKCKTCGVVG